MVILLEIWAVCFGLLILTALKGFKEKHLRAKEAIKGLSDTTGFPVIGSYVFTACFVYLFAPFILIGVIFGLVNDNT